MPRELLTQSPATGAENALTGDELARIRERWTFDEWSARQMRAGVPQQDHVDVLALLAEVDRLRERVAEFRGHLDRDYR